MVITAQLSYPLGVSPQVGTFTWTVSAPNLAPIVEGVLAPHIRRLPLPTLPRP